MSCTDSKCSNFIGDISLNAVLCISCQQPNCPECGNKGEYRFQNYCSFCYINLQHELITIFSNQIVDSGNLLKFKDMKEYILKRNNHHKQINNTENK